MTESTLGTWLRSERERRGITLKTVADQTKLAAPLLEGLECGDLSRWPGGIYRRAIVKAYASAVGLDADEVVKRFDLEHAPADATTATAAESGSSVPSGAETSAASATPAHEWQPSLPPRRARLIGTAADLTVALVLGLGSAAAGSRLLWPVLLIAGYYAIGVLLKGTSPMVALLSDEAMAPAPREEADPDASRVVGPRVQPDRRPASRRAANRAPRPARAARARH